VSAPIAEPPPTRRRRTTRPSCTFCGRLAVVTYPCPDFQVEVGTLQVSATAPWRACDSCRNLVDELDRDGLVARAMLAQRRQGMIPTAEVATLTRVGYSAFVALHDADPRPIGALVRP
jgi:hypothetical protein